MVSERRMIWGERKEKWKEKEMAALTPTRIVPCVTAGRVGSASAVVIDDQVL